MRLAPLCLLLALAQDTADPYYKFAKDTSWSYAMVGGPEKGKKMTMKVTGEADGKVTADMAEGDGGKASKMVWYVTDGIFYWAEKKGDAGLKEAIGLFKVGSKKGDTWSSPGTDVIQKYAATHMGRVEIKVPAATYKDAVHVRLDVIEGADTVKLDLYLVEKVGVVKMAYTLGDNSMSMDLEEFKPAK